MSDLASSLSRPRGTVAEGFATIEAAFARSLLPGDAGAALSVVRDGEALVDLAAGTDGTGRPWAPDTLMPVFSGTKALAGLVMAILVDRGAFDPDEAVARVWPAFAAGGKQDLAIGDALSHRGRLPGIRSMMTPDDVVGAALEDRVAAEAPNPDRRAGQTYHPLTIGAIAGGLCRRSTGHSIARVFAEEVARPNGLDVHIAAPEDSRARHGAVTFANDWTRWHDCLLATAGSDALVRDAWANPALFGAVASPWNGALQCAEIPGAGGVATASGMARLMALLAGGGAPLLRAPALNAAVRPRHALHDPCIGDRMAFGLLFRLQSDGNPLGPPADAFGHTGAGGSVHAAWPGLRAGVSFLPGTLRAESAPARSAPLLEAVHDALTRR